MGLSFRGMTLVERLFATSFNTLQRFAFVRRGRSWVPSTRAGEGQGEGKSSGNESTHPNEKCCMMPFQTSLNTARHQEQTLDAYTVWQNGRRRTEIPSQPWHGELVRGLSARSSLRSSSR